jgi:hypothetical protein
MSDEDTSEISGMDQRAVDAGLNAINESFEPDNPVPDEALFLALAVAQGNWTPGQSEVDPVVSGYEVLNFTEVVDKMEIDDGGVPGVGTRAKYIDGLYDADGTRVGQVSGNCVVLTLAPHIWQYHDVTYEFEDGTLKASGSVDGTATVHGMTVVGQVTGVSGRYTGMTGVTRMAMSDPTKTPPHYATTLVIC